MKLDPQASVAARSAGKAKPLWTCPECGRQFVTARMWHSCGNYALDDHFVGKDAIVREIFDRLVRVVQGFGPVTVYAQKTRIVLQARTRFVAVVPHNCWLGGHVWLKRKADHPRFLRVERYASHDYVHLFRLTRLEELDCEFVVMLREAYALGSGAFTGRR